MASRRAGSKSRIGVVIALAGVTLFTMFSGEAQAQTTGLDQLSNWYLAEVEWRDRGSLPVDNECTAPLVAQYNWGYGAILMGLNVRARGTTSYYAAVALNDNAQLDCLDRIGPMTGPALWDAGKYHLAAGMPNGQLVVWLTAPGVMPHSVVISDRYVPGTGFDVSVYPPDPLSSTWKDWFISAAYEYDQDTVGLLVESFDGAGNSRGITSTLSTPGDLVDVEYTDYPQSDNSAYTAYVLFTCLRDNKVSLGNNAHTSLIAAWYNRQDDLWMPASLRNTGLYLGNCHIGWNGSTPNMLIAFDESDKSAVYAGLQLLSTSIYSHGQVESNLHSSCWLPAAPERYNLCFLDSARATSPFNVLSDGADVFFGWRTPVSQGGGGVSYSHFMLYQGARVMENNIEVAQYPITGVAAAAHWSTGDPSLYWVQQGGGGSPGSALYQLVYWSGK